MSAKWWARKCWILPYKCEKTIRNQMKNLTGALKLVKQSKSTGTHWTHNQENSRTERKDILFCFSSHLPLPGLNSEVLIYNGCQLCSQLPPANKTDHKNLNAMFQPVWGCPKTVSVSPKPRLNLESSQNSSLLLQGRLYIWCQGQGCKGGDID